MTDSNPRMNIDITQVRVLATLDHPYIIGYYDSFEKDGVLMIGKHFIYIFPSSIETIIKIR